MKHCKSCELTYKDDKNFCEECGKKLTEYSEVKEDKKIKNLKDSNTKKIKTALIALGIIVLIIVVGIAFSYYSSIQFKTTTANQNPVKQCIDVQEPYTIQVPYIYEYRYSVSDSKCEGLFDLKMGAYTKASISVSNAESSGGIFNVNFGYRVGDNVISKTDSKFIDSDSTQVFSTILDSSLGQNVICSSNVIPATETRYKEEISYKTVQKCE